MNCTNNDGVPSTTITYPVSSSLLKTDHSNDDRNNVIAALVGVAPFDQIKISGDTVEMPVNPNTDQDMDTTNVQAAIDLGFDAVVSIKGSGEASYFLQNYIASFDHSIKNPCIITSERYAIGFRIMVKAWNLTTTTSVSLASIAADCTLKGASTSIQIQTIGIEGSDILSSLPELSSICGNVDANTLQTISTIGRSFVNYINEQCKDEDKRKKLKPELIAVELDLGKMNQAYENSASSLLGLSGIQQGYTFKDTWGNHQPGKDKLPSGMTTTEDVSENMYKAIMGQAYTATKTPTPTQMTQGKKSNFRGE